MRVDGAARDGSETLDNTRLPVRHNVKPPNQQVMRDVREGKALASAGRSNVFDADYSFELDVRLINRRLLCMGPNEYPLATFHVVRELSFVRATLLVTKASRALQR